MFNPRTDLVLFLLGVTGIDPVANGLVFERWLSNPRIELDVEWERRDDLLEYLHMRYDGETRSISVLGMKQLSELSEARKSRELGKPGARFWHHAGWGGGRDHHAAVPVRKYGWCISVLGSRNARRTRQCEAA